MTEQAYLITFTKALNSDCMRNFAGFKIFGKEQAKLYMKSLKQLEEGCCVFDFEDLQFPYVFDEFNLIKLTTKERQLIEKIFDISIEDGAVGIFPDAIDDAVELNVIDDEYSEDDSESDYSDYDE